MGDAMPEKEIIWKTHPVYVHYQASSDGQIRSLDRFVTQGNHLPGVQFEYLQRGRVLKQFLVGQKRCQYLAFDLAPGDGKKRKMRAHRFICEVFHGPAPSLKHQVRHLNGNPQDNHIENLAWGTPAENAQDRIRHGRQHRGGSRKTVNV